MARGAPGLLGPGVPSAAKGGGSFSGFGLGGLHVYDVC